jgi:isopenicillin N synthase-like dioxygenase
VFYSLSQRILSTTELARQIQVSPEPDRRSAAEALPPGWNCVQAETGSCFGPHRLRSRNDEVGAMNQVPVVDIGAFETGNAAARGAVAAQMAAAVEEIGFLAVTGHGVPETVIEEMRGGAWKLFGLPAPSKERYLDRSMLLNRGYTPFESEHNGSSRTEKAPADLREGFIYGPFDRPDDDYHRSEAAAFAFQDNIWPDAVPGLEDVLKTYYRAVEAFNERLLRVFAAALDLEPDFFADKFDRHASTVRLLHYPAQDTDPPAGQLRCGAHTDFGSHTILLADDTPGGLQVRSRSGTWLDVFPPKNSFVINIGDLMMVWTNDRWLSNLHRVVNPPTAIRGRAARLSIAFFVHPNRDASIECIPTCREAGEPVRHPPVLAGDYRRMQVTQVTAGLP